MINTFSCRHVPLLILSRPNCNAMFTRMSYIRSVTGSRCILCFSCISCCTHCVGVTAPTAHSQKAGNIMAIEGYMYYHSQHANLHIRRLLSLVSSSGEGLGHFPLLRVQRLVVWETHVVSLKYLMKEE